jgi:tRNA(Ile)-lysidine synthase
VLSWQQRVENAIVRRDLIRPGQCVLVAVSGGVDSMVLLHVLAEFSTTHGWKLVVAHFNHQLRARSSSKDEQLVRQTARSLKLPIVVGRAKVRAFAQRKRLSIEMAARQLRHQFLAKVAIQKAAASVALAHHVDDQVELFFVRLFRGSGGQGIAGMKWTSPSPADPSVTLVRPMLDRAKHELTDFARVRKIAFRHDASNDLLHIQRNGIRHELLPLLQSKYQPAVRANVLRLMEIVGAEGEFVESVAQSWVLANQQKAKGKPTLNQSGRRLDSFVNVQAFAFGDLPVAVQRRCLQLQLIEQGIQTDYDLIEYLRRNPTAPVDAKVFAATGALAPKPKPGTPSTRPIRIARDPSGRVGPAPVDETGFDRSFCELRLDEAPRTRTWGGVKFAWRVLARKGAVRPHARRGTELFDADVVGERIQLRHWLPGDRFQPIGMPNPVKLQDLFVNQKVPRSRRKQLIVGATAKGELFWVEGLRIAERFKLSEHTIRRVQWALQRL